MSEGTVIDARARFADERNEKEADSVAAAARHAESLQQTRARLEEADQIAREVSSSRRVPEADRPLLARNLGRMIEAQGADKAHSRIADLFRRTFGSDGAASALKKRKRFIRLDGEAMGEPDMPGEYQADGRVFLRLAEGWAELARSGHSSPDDVRRQAVLNLVENTGFDSRTRSSLRRSEAGRQEFTDRMDDVLAAVEAGAGDLNAYFDAAGEIDLEADIVRMDARTSFYLQNNLGWTNLRLPVPDPLDDDVPVIGPSGENGDRLDRSTHWLAPKVLIGFLYAPVPVDDAVSFTLRDMKGRPSHDDELVQILIERYGPDRQALYETLVSEHRKDAESIPDYDFEDIEAYVSHRDAERACALRFLQRLQSELALPALPADLLDLEAERIRNALIEQYGLAPSGLIDASSESLSEVHFDIIKSGYTSKKPLTAWVAHSVILSLHRERSTGRTRLAFTVSADEMRLEYDRVIYRFPRGARDQGYSSSQFEDGTVSCFMERDDKGYLFGDEFDLRLGSDLEGTRALHFIPGNQALDMAFRSVGRDLDVQYDAVFSPLYNDYPKAFSPAPPNTIAGSILRNLAYAPEGERLDELLLADARDKVGALQTLLRAEEDRYRQGVRRLIPKN
ncbi:hypothetical protein [Methylobacterium sp. WSM2598]|uniref:hypothetical protein n=1 Tax=Methylobacterium sp. WSM2598 TaxID=398261 RepID=UPI00037FA6FC|nr:hypothetical protein [Methylobacterium sp. WSM2598]